MKTQIPWLRVLIEGVMIVGSILLAFGIDAWCHEAAAQRLPMSASDAEGLAGASLVQEEQNKGQSVFLGALLGAAVGGGLGAAALTADDDCEGFPSFCLSRGQAFVVGAGIGAVVGGVAGWLVASGRTAGGPVGASGLTVLPVLGPGVGVQGRIAF